jgi:O-antigen/teichoic acid export membrane protein
MTAAYAFACTFLVLVTAIKYKPKTSNYSEKLRDHGGLLRKEQLYFFANAVSNTFWAQAPIFLAGIMVSASFSRDMAIVVRYCQILTIVVVVFNFTFAPVARRYFIENRSDELYDLWKSTAAKMILISAPVGVAMPFILISGYSSMLTASVEWKIVLFPWLVQMVINFFGPIGYLLIATERVKDLAYINTGFALIASLVLACFAKYINPFLFVYVIFGAYLLNKVVQYVYALYNVKLPSRLV